MGFVNVCVCVCVISCFNHVQLFAILCLWTVACQAPLSKGFSRQEYWSGLLRPPPEDLPHPGTGPVSPASHALQADSWPLSNWVSPLPHYFILNILLISSIMTCWISPIKVHRFNPFILIHRSWYYFKFGLCYRRTSSFKSIMDNNFPGNPGILLTFLSLFTIGINWNL